MTDHPIHVGPAYDADRFLATDRAVWFSEPSTATLEERLLGLPADQRYAAEVPGADPAAYPGIYGDYAMTLWSPGAGATARELPCTGLTWVGVHPDHRRRGVLTAMVRHHLERARAQEGVHVSALHASEPGIYGRFGYGLASLAVEVTLGRGTTFDAPHLEEAAAGTTTRMGSVTEPDAHQRIRRVHVATAELGTVAGEPDYYARLCRQLPEELRGKEPWRLLYARRDGADVGFAMFRRTQRWERSRPAGSLEVWTVVGDPVARLVLMRRLVEFDLVTSVQVHATGVDDPLLRWVGGPRATADVATYDNLWLRLVDLPEALEARAWSAPCDVVVEVDDPLLPDNHGTWRIRAGADGVASVERTADAAEVALPVATLGAAYLGGGNLVAMQQAGQLVERRPGAVTELWRAMRTDVAPTAAWMF